MRDDRGNRLSAKPLRELRATIRAAGAGRAFGRGLRSRIPLAARWLLITSALMVFLSLGSVLGFDLLRQVFDFELQPTYRIYSFRWWAEELVKTGILLGVPLLLVSMLVYRTLRGQAPLRAAVAVELGFCGGCGYRLTGLERAHDHCVVCPECGAAWRATHEAR